MLTDAEVDAFDEGRVDLPAVCGQHLLHRLQGAEHDAMTDPHQTPAASGLDHLRIEQCGPRHPAWFWGWPFALTALGVNPLSIVGEQGCHVLPEPVDQKQRGTVRGQQGCPQPIRACRTIPAYHGRSSRASAGNSRGTTHTGTAATVCSRGDR